MKKRAKIQIFYRFLKRATLFSDFSKWVRVVGWFLFLSYFLGSPAFALAEFRSHLLTDMFGYSVAFIYLSKAAQFVCALLLWSKRFRLLSIGVLTITAIGAFVSFLNSPSPLAGLPAMGYTLLQVWLGCQVYRRDASYNE